MHRIANRDLVADAVEDLGGGGALRRRAIKYVPYLASVGGSGTRSLTRRGRMFTRTAKISTQALESFCTVNQFSL